MAEDDDDESFGDFTFAATSSSISHPLQIYITTAQTTSSFNNNVAEKDDDEDDWGDFVTPRSDSATNQKSDLKSINLVAEKGVTARGALPLSIFGEEEGENELKEEEEEERKSEVGFGGKNQNLAKKGSDLRSLGINDLLASLYDQGDGKMKDGNVVNHRENGLKKEFDVLDTNASGYLNGLGSSAASDIGRRTVDNEELFNFGVMSTGTDGFSTSAKAFSQGEVSKVENGRRTKSDESAFNFLNMSSVSDFLSFNGSNVEANGSKLGNDRLSKSSSLEDNDEDEWEFQGIENVTNKPEYDMEWDIKSSDEPKVLHVNSRKENEMHGEWEFQDFAAPTVNDDINVKWNFSVNSIPAVKKDDNSAWDFQDFATPAAADERDRELTFGSNMNTSVEEEDDDGWEFHAAPVDQNLKQEWQMEIQGFGAPGNNSQDTGPNSKPIPSSGVVNPIDVSSPSGHDFGFDSYVSSNVPQDDLLDNSDAEGNQYGIDNQSASAAFKGSADADDSYWNFQNSFPETSLRNEVNKGDISHKGALSPSLFSDEPLDGSDYLSQDVSSFNPSQAHSNGFKNIDPSASLSDLILNLYNQSEKLSAEESTQQDVTDGSDAFQNADGSILSHDEDDFDGTWDFKDATLSSIADDNTSNQVNPDSRKLSRREDLVDFYCKLKDQSCLAAICHLSNLKEAKCISENAEDSEMEALDAKIKEALEELNKAGIGYGDAPENCTADNCLRECHQLLSEPKFELLDSEYGLSRRLSAAEKDMKSAIKLVEHAASLSMGSAEQQSAYVSSWTEILCVCAQELQHGAYIWQRAIEKSVSSLILSQIKGKEFVRGLGEIFRVVVILEASSKAYRPWILSNSTDADSIIALLSECLTSWSSSGLNEALKELSKSADSKCAGEVQALLESINHIREINVPDTDSSLRHEDSECAVSLLDGELIPDVKMVVWNEAQFFLPLANLWANLISSDPPNLPRLHAG